MTALAGPDRGAMAPMPDPIPVKVLVDVQVRVIDPDEHETTIRQFDRAAVIREYLEMVDVEQLSTEVMAAHDPSRNLFEGVLQVLHEHAGDG